MIEAAKLMISKDPKIQFSMVLPNLQLVSVCVVAIREED